MRMRCMKRWGQRSKMNILGESKWRMKVLAMRMKMRRRMNSTCEVKYGVLNPTADPNGVFSCSFYGRSYLILRNEVRSRATIAATDSALDGRLATFERFNHILMTYSDAELKAVAQVATDQKPSISTDKLFHYPDYTEVHIHGPLSYSRDVERLVVEPRYRALKNDDEIHGSNRQGEKGSMTGKEFWEWMGIFKKRNPAVQVVWMDDGSEVASGKGTEAQQTVKKQHVLHDVRSWSYTKKQRPLILNIREK
ncbi:hypothetical protein BC936DRAFT_148856 [Jimgerdemannia flammicorona]|uniref:Uncharacterized protein n=1 Tax=Jimgerdemannia flammicorona TaxID=994334 RepID=A0A433D255_9FUNG|nr:hypothetical protein BC936DRAFT_148856 [Jimgerdemannia flammicorona]